MSRWWSTPGDHHWWYPTVIYNPHDAEALLGGAVWSPSAAEVAARHVDPLDLLLVEQQRVLSAAYAVADIVDGSTRTELIAYRAGVAPEDLWPLVLEWRWLGTTTARYAKRVHEAGRRRRLLWALADGHHRLMEGAALEDVEQMLLTTLGERLNQSDLGALA